MEPLHNGVLKKFEMLKGELLIGREAIKGINSKSKLPADKYVPAPHILHDLIRGFYKPAGKPYLLSYQATESSENYGKQIIWDESRSDFLRIEMHPPNGEKDNRKKSDIAAARYNMKNKIPIGILHKVKKGQNRVLGLGLIVFEKEDGVFIVEPFNQKDKERIDVNLLKEILEKEEIDTSIVQKVLKRRGQEKFRRKLLLLSQECAVCGMSETSLLMASHIKPWRQCSNIERLDHCNGLLLCPNHDKVFDKGFITFSNDGKIIISSLLSRNVIDKMNLCNNIKINVCDGMKEYLKCHRDTCFQK